MRKQQQQSNNSNNNSSNKNKKITRKLRYRKDDRAMRPTYGRPEKFQGP